MNVADGPSIIQPQMPAHQPLYDLCEAYDIAFDFRDLSAECDALDAICRAHRGGAPASFLDVACGPGYHCIEYARRGLQTVGLDLNPKMLDYASAKARTNETSAEFMLADMRDFKLRQPVDLAFCAMSSFHYLLTNEDTLAHLRTVARNLTPGGLYVIEAEHPRDVFRVGQSLQHEWESQRGETIVRSSWGKPDDPFDPITQVCTTTVRLEVVRGGGTEKYEFISLNRHLTHQELQLLIAASGVFEPVAWLGVLDIAHPLTNEKASYRMIPVLRKK